MRVSTAQMQDRAVTAMLDRQADISKTQVQLATGKRILAASDDVYGTTQALAIKQVIATHEQYQVNSNILENRLQQEETTLTHVTDVLQRARELSIQAQNTIYSASDRANLAFEVRGLLDESLALANSVDSDGEYIFAGFNVDTAPFVAVENPVGSGLYDYNYTGDLGQRRIQVGASRQIATGDPGQDVFIDVPESGGGTRSIFETLEQLAIDLETNTPDPTVTDDLLLGIQHMAEYLAKVGGRLAANDNHRSLNADIILQGNSTLSEVQDLDYAEAVSRMNLQMVGLEASQQSFSRIQNLSLFNFL